MANKSKGLQERHWQALKLIEAGDLPLKDIAARCSIDPQALYALYEGNTQKMGELGDLFQSELHKITARNSSKIKELLKTNKKIALIKINEYLRMVKHRKPSSKLMKELLSVVTGLSKATPSVEIGQVNYHKGLSASELVHEFKRLGSIAEFTLERKRVRSVEHRGQGVLPAFDAAGGLPEEEPEAPSVQT